MMLVTYDGKDIPSDWLAHAPGKPRAYVVPLPFPPAKQLGRRAMKLIDELMAQTDVVHLHGPWLDGNRQIARLASRRGVPYILSLHGMLDDWSMSKSAWKKRLYMQLTGRQMLNRAACLHCTATAELSQASKWFDNPSTAVLPYLMDLQPFQNLPGPEAGLALLPKPFASQPRLLFLSRLSEQKGIEILIRAAGLMHNAGTPFVLLIAGTGFPAYEKRTRALVTELNLDDRVLFLGLVTGREKISLYQAADLFVLPTLQENFGLVLTEAMACGTAVLTTRGTDIWREVQSAGGEIVDATPHAIASAATSLLANPTDRRERGNRGRNWVMTNLAVDPLRRQYESLYEEIIDQNNCHR
jgi:glycosyltransferase involved in cell wall biosynthesis